MPYEEAEPYYRRIHKINRLHDLGHEVIYWTARGMATGIDYKELTEKQLASWGCRFSELRMSKPSYDMWIDDKAEWIFDD